MKKILFTLFALVAFAVSVTAQSRLTKVTTTQQTDSNSPAAIKRQAPAAAPNKVPRYQDVSMSYVPASMYDELDNGLAEYYFVATSSQSQFNSNDGTLSMPTGCYAVLIDFYNDPSDPIHLPAGTYKPSSHNEAFTYDPSFTVVQQMNLDGSVTEFTVDGDINVTYDERTGLYTVTLQPIYLKTMGMMQYYLRISYTGDMGFRGSNVEDQFYPTIAHNINEKFTGALGIYRGNEMESNTGCMWLYVFNAPFNDETGALTGPGIEIRMFLFNRLFGDPSTAEPVPGTYTVARNFHKDTFFPGMEINYMGATVPYGSIAFETDGNEVNDKVAYITDGTYTIDYDGETGNYTLILDLRTSLGYKIQGTYTGPIKVIDAHVENSKVAISTLEEDLDLDLSRIKSMDVYRDIYTKEIYGETSYVSPSTFYVSDVANEMGLTHYTLDMGYGVDAEIIGTDGEGNTLYGTDGGDLMRLELLTEKENKIFPMGTYDIMQESLSANPGQMAPWKAVPGYFLPGGELGGTRWAHNAPNPYADRYWHWDGHAPAADGKFTLKQNDDNTVTVDINVIDDAGFAITGQWTGPLHFNWDIDAEGIGTVLAPGVGESGIYDLSGRKLNLVHEGLNIINGKKVLK